MGLTRLAFYLRVWFSSGFGGFFCIKLYKLVFISSLAVILRLSLPLHKTQCAPKRPGVKF